MKKIIYPFAFCLAINVVTSCGNASEKDSKEVADSSNHAKIDNAANNGRPDSAIGKMADMKPDADFAVAAADGGLLEVELGKLAVEKGRLKQIKDLGAMMVKDHSKVNEELKAAAKAKDITLPASMSDKCQKKVADLREKSGGDFDKAYTDLMVRDHKEDIDAFKKEADKGNDPELKAWASGKLSILEHHLMMSENAKKVAGKK
jgi:putative membrane protein